MQIWQILEEALCDRLVCGLRTEAIQSKLLAEDKLTLKKAHDMAYGIEIASKQVTVAKLMLLMLLPKKTNTSSKMSSLFPAVIVARLGIFQSSVIQRSSVSKV